MKLRAPLILMALLGLTTAVSAETAKTDEVTTTVHCTPEEAVRKAEETAVVIHRITDGNPEKAAHLHEQLQELQRRDPTRSEHGACEAYERIIKELKQQNGQAD